MLTLPAIQTALHRVKKSCPSPTFTGKNGSKDPMEKVRSQLLVRQMLQLCVVQNASLFKRWKLLLLAMDGLLKGACAHCPALQWAVKRGKGSKQGEMQPF